jgi:hypothetical protein
MTEALNGESVRRIERFICYVRSTSAAREAQRLRAGG